MTATRRTCLAVLALAAGLASAVHAQSLPRQNLWIELRWVEQDLSGAAVAGVRDGSVVVSTGGTVTARGGVALSTQTRSQRMEAMPRVMVLNGAQAGITLNDLTPVQWVDVAVDRRPGQPDQVFVSPRQGVHERIRGFSVLPRWPGGQQPVTVEVRTRDQSTGAPPPMSSPSPEGSGSPAAEVVSTVQAPLGQWVTIARSGQVQTGGARGSYSTRDAEVQRLRELQIRVDAAVSGP